MQQNTLASFHCNDAKIMKRLLTAFIVLIGTCVTQEGWTQVSPVASKGIEKKVLRIRKASSKKVMVNSSTQVADTSRVVEKTQTTKPFVGRIKQLPTISSGSFAYLPYSFYQPTMKLEGTKYVIFEFKVSGRGASVDLETVATNEPRLERLVFYQLRRTRWNPALTHEGKAVTYEMPRMIVRINERTYEEDYLLRD